MKLFFSPGACSLAAHIALHEIGAPFETERVNLRDKKTASGADFTQINPKGYVPALQLDNGEVLTENAAVLQYIADLAPEKTLAPAGGTMARYRLIEMLHFIATEVHKSYSPLFRPDTPEQTKDNARQAIARRVGYLAEGLQKSTYLLGEDFTVADAYLFVVLGWSKNMNIDLSPWPGIVSYLERIAQRPAVKAARAAEGLDK